MFQAAETPMLTEELKLQTEILKLISNHQISELLFDYYLLSKILILTL